MKVASSSKSEEADSQQEQRVSCVPAIAERQTEPAEHPLHTKELDGIRGERLQLIRQLIEQGQYDSDEILEKAMERMMAQITNGAEMRNLSEPGRGQG